MVLGVGYEPMPTFIHIRPGKSQRKTPPIQPDDLTLDKVIKLCPVVEPSDQYVTAMSRETDSTAMSRETDSTAMSRETDSTAMSRETDSTRWLR